MPSFIREAPASSFIVFYLCSFAALRDQQILDYFYVFVKDSFTSIIFLTLPRVVLGISSQNTPSLGSFAILGNLMKDLFAEDNLIIFCLFVNTNHQQFQYPLKFTIGFFSEKQITYRNFQLEKLVYRR